MLGAGAPETEEIVSFYRLLPEDQLRERILEERDRAKSLDEKTSHMTLAFTLALAVVGAAAALVKGLTPSASIVLINIGIIISAIYILLGGCLALAGLRTLPQFGYGTGFRIAVKEASDLRHVYVDHLLRQEKANQLRQIRNEAAFQSLRNGFVVFVVVLIIYLLAFRAGSTAGCEDCVMFSV
jgi:hypothetical protein